VKEENQLAFAISPKKSSALFGSCVVVCLLYMLRGGKQDTTVFLKYCDLYQGFV